MSKYKSLEPRGYVIKVGKKCFVKEENGKEWNERKYMLVADPLAATSYQDTWFGGGIEELQKRADVLGGELYEIYCRKVTQNG